MFKTIKEMSTYFMEGPLISGNTGSLQFAIFSSGQVCFSKDIKGNSSFAENWIEDL